MSNGRLLLCAHLTEGFNRAVTTRRSADERNERKWLIMLLHTIAGRRIHLHSSLFVHSEDSAVSTTLVCTRDSTQCKTRTDKRAAGRRAIPNWELPRSNVKSG